MSDFAPLVADAAPAAPATQARRTAALLLGPARSAVSGVSTHLNLLFASGLAEHFALFHFQVGSEGRREGRVARMLRLLCSPAALMVAILRHRIDIVHINTSLNRGAFWRDVVYLFAAKACGARVLYQVHGGDLPLDFCANHRVPQRLLHWLLSIPEVIIVLASIELGAYREFLPRQRVMLLPNSVDCAAFSGLARHDHGENPLRLVYIGRLAEGKGLEEALRGLRLAHAAGTRARLAIAGSGPLEQRLRDLACDLGLGAAVSFPGPVFGDDKLRLLEQSDALLLPSYSEGLPYALMECMAAGLPVIVTRVGAIPDVVSDGVHGLFVELRDAASISEAIGRLDGDRALLARMGAACRRHIAGHYSMQRLAGEFGKVYAALRAPGRGRRYPTAS